jgi:hypothetical protein
MCVARETVTNVWTKIGHMQQDTTIQHYEL